MKRTMLMISFAALAGLLASPAGATSKHKAAAKHSAKHSARHAAAQQQVDATPSFQGGVRKGPLYNGQDYLGDDPDPGIRAYLLKDMTRYQGSY